MNESNNGTKVPWGTKVGYIGTGILIGLIAYPFVKKALGDLQPRLDSVLDGLTGKAENLAEKAADLMARAKEGLGKSNSQTEHEAEPPHNHV